MELDNQIELPIAVPEVVPIAVPEVVPIAVPEVVPIDVPEVVPIDVPEVVPIAASEVEPIAAPEVIPITEVLPITVPGGVPIAVSEDEPLAVSEGIPIAVREVLPNGVPTTEPESVPLAVSEVVPEVTPISVTEVVPESVPIAVPVVEPVTDIRTKLDSYASDENDSILNGYDPPGSSDTQQDSHETDEQIIRDIEAEIDEKLESLSRQSTDQAETLSFNDRSSGNQNDFSVAQELDLSDSDDRSDSFGTSQKCPDEEIRFRTEHDLVHKMEMRNGTPDPDMMVKEYRRSSADNNDLSKLKPVYNIF